jgi:hypothetical protein
MPNSVIPRLAKTGLHPSWCSYCHVLTRSELCCLLLTSSIHRAEARAIVGEGGLADLQGPIWVASVCFYEISGLWLRQRAEN